MTSLSTNPTNKTILSPQIILGSKKLPTFQPFLLVTSDYDIARKFMSPGSSFYDILKDIKDSDEILLSPTKNNQYFQNFDYNIGYTKSDVFTVDLTLIDSDYKFETFFLKFLFNEERYRKLAEDNLVKELLEKINKNIFDPSTPLAWGRLERAAEESAFNIEEIQSRLNKKIVEKIQSFVYFVFGINDVISTPIVTQFRSCEVSQSSDGFKKIKLIFQTMGHPYLLSDLTKFNPNTEGLGRATEESGYKKYVAYELTQKANLVSLVKEKLLDSFIKTVIKNLFTRVSNGKDVVVLLPDFDKLYEKFIKTHVFDSRIQALITSKEPFHSPQLSFRKNDLIIWYQVTTFLRFLGFEIETDFFKKRQEREGKIPEEVKTKLQDFQNQIDLLKTYFRDLKLNDQDFARLFEAANKGIDPALQVRIDYLVKEKIINRNELEKRFNDYKTIKERYLDSLRTLLLPAYWEKNKDPATGVNTRNDPFKSSVDDLEGRWTEYLFQEFAIDLGVEPRNKSNQIDYTKINTGFALDTTEIKFLIIQKLDGTSELDKVIPHKTSYINFYKFLNEFSINMSKISQDILYKIGVFEENDLTRLSVLKQNCKDYYSAELLEQQTTLPLISNESTPALVIAEDWIVRNYYTPLTTTKLNNKFYPLSEKDEKNFGANSPYYRFLYTNRIINNKFLNSSFGENITTDYLDINTSVGNNKNFDELPFSMPIFLCNDTRANVLSYSLDVDKLQHTSTFYQLVNYSQKSVLTEALAPVRQSILSQILNFDTVTSYIKDYVNTKKSGTEDLIIEITNQLKSGKVDFFNQANKFPVKGSGVKQGKEAFDYFAQKSGSDSESFASSIASYLVDDFLTNAANNGNTVNFRAYTDLKLNPLILKWNNKKELYQKLFVVSIKTLPFFHLNNIERLFSGAILIIKNLVNPKSPINIADEYNFLSGLYFIQSFRHVIGLTSAYSEFSLIKNPDVGGIE